MRGRILVVEDDDTLRETLCDNLADEGYAVQHAATLAQARVCLEQPTDIIVLDIMLADGDGYSLCRSLRRAGDHTPIIMLTARSLEEDLIKGFASGADDYLAKPYRLRELLARIAALLRRNGRQGTAVTSDSIQFSGYTLDTAAHTLHDLSGTRVHLTHKEFGVLKYLVEHRGQAITRDRLLSAVWGEDVLVEGRTVDNFISILKKKLKWSAESGFRIETIRGVGYRLET